MPNNNDYKRKQSSAFISIPKQCMEFQDLEGFLKHFLAPISTTLVAIDLSLATDIERKASINGRSVTFEITDAKKEKKNKAGVFSLQQEDDLTLAITHDVSLNFIKSQSGKYEIFLNTEASALGLLKPKEVKSMEISLRQAEKLIALALNHRNQIFTEGNCINNFKEYQIFNFLEEDLFENIDQTKGEIFNKNYKKIETRPIIINHYLGDLLKTPEEIEYFEKLCLKGAFTSKNILAPEEIEFLNNILDKKGLSSEIGKKTYNELFVSLKKEFLICSLHNKDQKVLNVGDSNKIPEKERPLSAWVDEPDIEYKMPKIVKLASQNSSQESRNLALNANKPLKLENSRTENGYTKILSNFDYFNSKFEERGVKPFIRIHDNSIERNYLKDFTTVSSNPQSKILKAKQTNGETEKKANNNNQKNNNKTIEMRV